MRRWLVRLAILAGIVLLGFALRATVFAPKPVEVEVVRVERGRVEQTVANSRAGTVKARRRAQLSPEIGGRVVAIPHREGERVAAGDVLLRLDPAVPEAHLALARRELQAAEAQREQACVAADRSVRERERLKRLAAGGIVSVDLLDQAETAAGTAAASCRAGRAGVDQARATIELAARQSAQTVVRSPFAGVVADLAIEVGEFTTPSPPGVPLPSVVDVIDPGSIFVSAPMDEVDSARIHAGQPARLSVDSFPGRHFPGRVLRVAPYVLDREEQNRTVEIEAGFDDPGLAARLLPGTSADVEVILAARDGALRVPTPAIAEGGTVLVVRDVRLAERKLRTGLRNWDYTEVLDGLAPGDEVVVSLDRPEVRPGAEVKVVRARAKARAGAAP